MARPATAFGADYDMLDEDDTPQTRYAAALRILNALPPDADARAVREAYPWGDRAHHPYKAWLRAVKDWKRDRARLAAFGGTRGGRA
jgi:hypothetical protein